MAVFSMTSCEILADGFAITGFANQLAVDAQDDAQDFTTFGSGGWRTIKSGLAMATVTASGFTDTATTGIEPQYPVSGFGATQTISVAPTGGSAAGDIVYFGSGVITSYTPLAGAVGDPATFQLGWSTTGPLVRGLRLHPSAARTASGNGSAVAFTAPTATQTLYANWHLLAVSGAGSITFTIQTDDNAGFTTPTTRITSSALTAVGASSGSLAGALTGETHIRVGYTIAGFTSATFVVSAGVL